MSTVGTEMYAVLVDLADDVANAFVTNIAQTAFIERLKMDKLGRKKRLKAWMQCGRAKSRGWMASSPARPALVRASLRMR
jgi:hypothetical protein